MLSGRVPTWVWVILLGSHMLGLSWSLAKGSWKFADSGRYLQAAENLRLYGELYARPWPLTPPHGQAVQDFTIRSLGYPLALLVTGGAKNGPVLILVLQNLLSLLNIGLILKWWAHRARPKGSTWALAILAILSFPSQLIYANAVMSELLLQTAVVAMVGFGILFIQRRKKRYFAGVTGAAIAALLLKPIFFPFTACLAIVGLILTWRHKRPGLALIGALPLMVAGLYMGWNWQRTGYFHFSSIAEINLLHYNAAGVIRQAKGGAAEEEWVASVLSTANAQPNFAARQHVIQHRAGRVLSEYPGVYAWQHAQGMAVFFLDPGRFDISEFLDSEPIPGGGLLAQARAGGLLHALRYLPFGLLGWLAVVLVANICRLVLAWRGFLKLKTSEPTLRYGRWIALALLVYVALLTGPLGAARFLVPVWPLLFALSLVGLQWAAMPITSDPEEAPPMGENKGQC